MIFENQTFDQERALYGLRDAIIKNCRFDGEADGESALKEAGRLEVSGCFMNLRYPFWHVTDAKISGTEFTENCRAALWYDKNVTIDDCKLNGIKALRECQDITLKNSSVSSPEFIWKCSNLAVENVEIIDSELDTKDAFWHTKNVTVRDSIVKGEYLGWYSENLTLINCKNLQLQMRLKNGD